MNVRVYKPLLFVACLLPVAWLILRIAGFVQPGLGANPAEEIQDELGVWALRLLLATLCVTPAARLLKKPRLYRFRRMLGLFAFFYCTLHPLAYFLLDLQLDFAHLGEDLLKRTFITVGMGAVLLLIPLAFTSTRGWQRRLGRRWNRLHRLIYPAAMLACWHFYWQVKADTAEPLVYCAILALLLGIRFWWSRLGGRLFRGG